MPDNFSKKIEYIYNILTKENLDELTRLFLNPEKKTIKEHRKKHIKKWLQGVSSHRLFVTEYTKYPFFKEVRFENKPIFRDGREFLSIDYDEFCHKIQKFNNLKIETNNKNSITQFLYLYIHNLKSNHIYKLLRYNITYEEKIGNEYKISIQNNTTKIIYNGQINIIDNKLFLRFENATLIINISYLNNKTPFLVGVIVGISNLNNQTVVAKKAILSKEKLDNHILYGILNETETIFALEHNVTNLLPTNSYNSIEKTTIKLENLDIYLSNLVKLNLYSNCYYQLAFNQLRDTKELFEKIKHNKSFHLFDRYSILEAIIKSHSYEHYRKLFLVMPIYNKYFIFNNLSQKTETIIKNLEYLAIKKDINIEILFIVIDCNQKMENLEENLNSLQKFAKLSFVSYQDIKKGIESIDFIYTDNKNFVIYKPLEFYREVFIYENNDEKVFNYDTIFRKIKKLSLPYNRELKLSNFCQKDKYFIEELIGEWHLYVYGSLSLSEYKLVIYEDNKLEVFEKNELFAIGTIFYKKSQSIIIFEHIFTNKARAGVIIFDTNLHAMDKAFIIKLIYKQYGNNDDIFTLGVCSKNPIKDDDLFTILRKDNSSVKKLIDNEVTNRLIKYLSNLDNNYVNSIKK